MNSPTKIAFIAVLAALALVSVAWAGSRSHAWLGVVSQEIDRDIAEDLSLKSRSGAIINEIINDSPADKAGLREDDVIIAFNDDKVRDDDDLTDLVQDSRPGDSVTLTIIRNGSEQKLPVKLGRRSARQTWFGNWVWPDVPAAPRVPGVPKVPGVPGLPGVPKVPGVYSIYSEDRPYIGITLIELSESAARALGATDGGVLIDDVDRDSPAETAGLKPGDLIVQIDKLKVNETEDVMDIFGDLEEGDTVLLSLIRDRKPLSVNVKVELDEGGGYYSGRRTYWTPGASHVWRGWDQDAKNEYFHDLQEYREGAREYEEEMRELEHELKKMQHDLGRVKKSHR